MSDRADFCEFYYAQTGQAAVWIRDEKRFMFSNTELAWQSWQAAQAQAGTKARRSAVNPEAGDYANCVDDIPQAQAGDGEAVGLRELEDFIASAQFDVERDSASGVIYAATLREWLIFRQAAQAQTKSRK